MKPRLGPFALGELLGRGGMGTVWEGTHAGLGAPVAVKVIAAKSGDNVSSEMLIREIRAMAAMTHPGIVTVHDYGFVDAEAERTSGGELVEGSPFLVMERATLGTLQQRLREGPPRTYPEIRDILLALLDALAHAHARGVIHRDVKPSNVLVTGGAKGSRAIKLSDFGISRRDGDGDDEHNRAGTPNYMAPEQILGEAFELGPWTDLYAVGCVAYALVRGTPPFYDAGTGRDVLDKQLVGAPPALEPDHPLPEGFDEWLRALLEKRPSVRYRRAADAAFGLRRLGDPEDDDAALGVRVSRPSMMTLGESSVGAPTEMDQLTEPTARLSALPPETIPASAMRSRPERAPLRSHWWSAQRDELPMPMAGVGLGLYGLRSIPMLGRNFERDVLWSDLRDAASTPRAKVTVLRGLPGTGKSRLAAWLCERAHELGAARILSATHAPIPEPGDGLLPMLERALRVGGIQRVEQLERRVFAELEGLVEHEGGALAESLVAFFRDARSPTRALFDRRAVVLSLLRLLARDRPLVIWLDDLQWGIECLELVEHVLENAPDLPVLFVATVRSDLLDSLDGEREALARVCARATVLDVEGLARPEHERLVRWLLGLEEALVEAVTERTAGRPLFAVQLVGDWVQRGILVPTEQGFRLADGAPARLPDDIHALWTHRLEHLETLFGEAALPCLEVSAALGQEVTWAQWRSSCGHAGIVAPEGLIDAMLEQRLAYPTESGFALGHSMLRESLERSARTDARWTGAHRACALAVEELSGDDPAAAESLAIHWEQAGDLGRALPHLRGAIVQNLLMTRIEHSRALCARKDRLLRELGVPESDARWTEHWLDECRLDRLAGDIESLAERLERAALNDPDHPGIKFRRADLLWLRSDASGRGEELLTEALAGSRARGDEELELKVIFKLATFLMDRGAMHVATVAPLIARATEIAEKLEDLPRQAGCLFVQWRVDVAEGEHEKAAENLRRATELARASGNLFDVGLAWMHRGQLAIQRGDPEGARRHLAETLELWDAIGAGLGPVAERVLVAAEVLSDHHEEAWARLQRLRESPLARSSRLGIGVAYVTLPCASKRGDWDGLESALATAERGTPATGHASEIHALCAEAAARTARDQRPDLADRAARLVALQRSGFATS